MGKEKILCFLLLSILPATNANDITPPFSDDQLDLGGLSRNLSQRDISQLLLLHMGKCQSYWKRVAYYNRPINYMLEKDITPYANINHYDLTQELQKRYGGWLSEKAVVIVALGYDNGFFAPGRCSKAFEDCKEGDSSTEPYVVAYNLIKCHVAASLRYHLKPNNWENLAFWTLFVYGDTRKQYRSLWETGFPNSH
ncbi:hypothetical protein M9H77_04320 [Catharanthus roseus]|uniref:Uncharacterized protein n=1 Tax=Catharanthus roseus TaxID=4058 RepID=A0ACC0CDR8_CATRO|nr:hypothetical protein M9H77_04320 [Catharanthus roseus]